MTPRRCIAICALAASASRPVGAPAAAPHDRPVISVLRGNEGVRTRASTEAALSDSASRAVGEIVHAEQLAIAALVHDSDRALDAAGPNAAARAAALSSIGYDAAVSRLLAATDSLLTRELSDGERARLAAWFDAEWVREAAEHAGPPVLAPFMAFTVYATQYAGETSEEAAVPDKYVKFASRDWQHASGYAGSSYFVTLAYGSHTAANVRVWDVGPWNEDDNFWDPAVDWPRPRRLFPDLPRGTPEAQAAYYSNYNGGKDQFGRRVLNPAGVDITPAVASRLGLGYLENAWVTVTYLWENEPTRASADSISEAGGGSLAVERIAGGFDLAVPPVARGEPPLRLSIVDMAGRAVRTWPIGRDGIRIRWCGERSGGGRAAAGVYAAVVYGGDDTRSRPIARTRLAYLP